MRIVMIGDTHAQHRDVRVPDGDVLLFAGDGEFRSGADLADFNAWLAGLPHAAVIAIAGNHDFFCESHPGEVRKLLAGAIYLRDEQWVLSNGMKVWGSPMTTIFQDWAFMRTEEHLQENYWSKIPPDADILLTHGPAYQHLDTREPGGKHIGSRTLARKIEELRIPYVVHGHIHGGYGIEKTDFTTYVNCAVLDEEYQLANQPIVIDV